MTRIIRHRRNFRNRLRFRLYHNLRLQCRFFRNFRFRRCRYLRLRFRLSRYFWFRSSIFSTAHSRHHSLYLLRCHHMTRIIRHRRNFRNRLRFRLCCDFRFRLCCNFRFRCRHHLWLRLCRYFRFCRYFWLRGSIFSTAHRSHHRLYLLRCHNMARIIRHSRNLRNRLRFRLCHNFWFRCRRYLRLWHRLCRHLRLRCRLYRDFRLWRHRHLRLRCRLCRYFRLWHHRHLRLRFRLCRYFRFRCRRYLRFRHRLCRYFRRRLCRYLRLYFFRIAFSALCRQQRRLNFFRRHILLKICENAFRIRVCSGILCILGCSLSLSLKLDNLFFRCASSTGSHKKSLYLLLAFHRPMPADRRN